MSTSLRSEAPAARWLAIVAATVVPGVLALVALTGRPDVPACFSELTRAQEIAVDDYRAGAAPIHVTLGLLVLAALWPLRGRGGAVLLVWAAVLIAGLAVPAVLALVGLTGAVVLLPCIVAGAVVVLTAAALTAHDPRGEASLLVVRIAAAWTAAVVVPAIFAWVWLIDESLCMS